MSPTVITRGLTNNTADSFHHQRRTAPYTNGDMQFQFVLSGQAILRLSCDSSAAGGSVSGIGSEDHGDGESIADETPCIVKAGDSWVLPPGLGLTEVMLAGEDTTADFTVLEIWMSEAPDTE